MDTGVNGSDREQQVTHQVTLCAGDRCVVLEERRRQLVREQPPFARPQVGAQ